MREKHIHCSFSLDKVLEGIPGAGQSLWKEACSLAPTVPYLGILTYALTDFGVGFENPSDILITPYTACLTSQVLHPSDSQ